MQAEAAEVRGLFTHHLVELAAEEMVEEMVMQLMLLDTVVVAVAAEHQALLL
jgi:hypothetical protein